MSCQLAKQIFSGLTSFTSWLLPATCVLCGNAGTQGLDLCKPCLADLPWLDEGCHQCAMPLIDTASSETRCGRCLKQAPPYDETIALWHYQTPITQLIARLKFHRQLLYARLLGELLAINLAYRYTNLRLPDLIIPVPLHKQRLKERGYNQAIELARPIAKRLHLPLKITSCQRIKSTLAQSSLSAKQRHKNLRGAFDVSIDLSGKHIAIVDDVLTTGYTVAELSHTLRQAGALYISVWCCARSTMHSK